MLLKNIIDNGLSIAIGGPSGSGKSTIINNLKNYFGTRIYGSITYTTRKPRKYEIDGEHYHFVELSEIGKYKSDPRYVEFVLARENWYWTDLSELIDMSQKTINGIYLTAITQVHEFIGRKQIFPKLNWIWLTAPSNELRTRLIKRGDKNIDESQKYNELLEKQDRSNLISMEINTSDMSSENITNLIIDFIEKK